MKSKNVIFLIASVVIVISVIYSFRGGSDDAAYVEQINKERE
jgi:hypothetical protein